ncbi:flavin reductase family protein [Arthrobacter sp. KNU40]|uniref:flavin reductase family protein n=1 Tax=Arthrobacter sp. KNU40 TaxID=3447965 RepID=UPI003F62CD0A
MTTKTAFNTRQFRDALGHFASGLTVISGTDGFDPIGFTCQSFYSVSTVPPLVSFSVMRDSTTYPRIRETGKFAVNVLSHQQHLVSTQFARRGTDKWAGVQWSHSPLGNPVLEETITWLDCELWAEHVAGDHFIVIGEVVGLGPVEPPQADPLIFFQGVYRSLEVTR